jgi:uncharacterized phage protein (TIGR01671 family)
MFPIDFRFWDGIQMLEATAISIKEKTVEAISPLTGMPLIYNLSDVILMPFTGFYDHKNQKIYTSDILQVTPMLIETVPSYKAIVEWDKYRFALRALNYSQYKSHIFPYSDLDPFGLHLTVIGDIHRNKEFLT